MIQYLGEQKLFNEKYIIFILFCIFLIEFKNYFSHKNFDYPEKTLKYKHIRRISD